MARAAPPAPKMTTFLPEGSVSSRRDSTKPLPSVFSPYPLSIFAYYAVYGTHEGCGLAESVQILDHLYLVRDGAVKPLEAHGLGALHCILKTVGGDLDGKVPPIQVVVAIGGLDHYLRGVLGNGLAEGSG